MTQSELAMLSGVNAGQLRAAMTKSFYGALAFRREVQVALTKYSKTHKEWDAIKAGAVKVCRQIESWCREAYYKERMVSVLKQRPELIKQSKQAAKTIVKTEFETLIARSSY